MKNKALLFVLLSFGFLSLLPIMNFLSHDGTSTKAAFLDNPFKADILLRETSDKLRGFGLSLLPEKAIVGKDSWMFLGDRYVNIVTTKRVGKVEKDVIAAKKIAEVFDSWDLWFEEQGVDDFHFLVGPDKATVYPDYLPHWATPSEHSPTDALFESGRSYFLDVRSLLMEARQKYSMPLYYKYDSHWNSLGGWIAFNAYLKKLRQKDNIFIIDEDTIQIGKPELKVVSGIANFFGLADRAKDTVIPISFRNTPAVTIEHYNYETGVLNKKLSSDIEIPKSNAPILIRSPEAMNKKKILWLRDSFGNAISPYVSLMFTETLQVNYRKVTPVALTRLVKEFQPDYVLMTVVERQVRDVFFQKYLPKNEELYKYQIK